MFNNRHTAENLSEKLLEVLEEFGILEKTWKLVTDSAKNMEKRKFIQCRCFLKVLFLIFQLEGL